MDVSRLLMAVLCACALGTLAAFVGSTFTETPQVVEPANAGGTE